MAVKLPGPAPVAQALSGITNKDVKTTPKKPMVALSLADSFVASYDDGLGGLECVVVMDIQLAASLGSALALIPPPVAKEAGKAKKIEGDMLDNAYEVANILANSFLHKRVRLVKFVSGAQVAEEVSNLIKSAKQAAQLEVTLSGNYPGGLMDLYASEAAV